MTIEKPNFEDFSAWAQRNLQFDPTERAFKSWVETNVRTFKTFVESHIFFTKIQNLVEQHKATAKHKEINIVSQSIDLNTKTFESILSKIYRLNIVENDKFPNPKGDQWVIGDNIFRELKDIVRTTIVCRHINEPAKIANLIAEICSSLNLEYKINAQAKEHGYYAYHIYITFEIELIDRDWGSIVENACLEIQVTTEMQYMLYALTHVFYEAEREKIANNNNDWKWDYKSSKFSASYLSHSLHLLEGLLLRLYEDVWNDTEKTKAAIEEVPPPMLATGVE